MEHAHKTGLSFGITSAIITTLGLIVGLYSSTHSKLAVIGGILTIALADAFSDALGIHISEESENKHTSKEIWKATLTTFLAKFFFTITFIIPIVFFNIQRAIKINVVYGFLLLSIYSFFLGERQTYIQRWKVTGEHLGIGILVVGLSHLIGYLINIFFNS